jgi:uncharacterized protein YoxC
VLQLHPLASGLLVFFYVFASLVLVGLVAFAAWMVWKLHNLLEKYETRINPVIDKADQVLTLISEKVDTIGGKAESILTQGEEMAESVHEKVDRTATTVQRTINAPIIKANSWAAALKQGFSTFTRLQLKQEHTGRHSPYAMELDETPEEIEIWTSASNGAMHSAREIADALVEVSETDEEPIRRVVTPVQEEEQVPLVLGRKG